MSSPGVVGLAGASVVSFVVIVLLGVVAGGSWVVDVSLPPVAFSGAGEAGGA